VEVLWPMDRAVDSGEGQPGPELRPSSSCGVHSWIEGASGDRWRVSWFTPQNQADGRRLKTPSRGGTGVGLGIGGGTGVDDVLGLAAGEEVMGVRQRLVPSEGRGGNSV
jgi:hypothetical protein